MDREIVIVVPSEADAFECIEGLEAIDDEGSIELYSLAVLQKTPTGEVMVKDTRERGPSSTAVGLTTGALIGLLGGPVGVAVGAAVGASAGLGGDLVYSGFAGEFIRDVSARLEPGSFAVCANIWEDWTTPVDVVVAAVNGAIFRQSTEDVIVAQMRAEMQASKDEQEHLEAEIQRAKGETKAKLEAKREELRKNQAARRQRLEKRANQLKAEWDAKIASIKEKATASRAEAKARHEQHVEKLRRFAAMQKESFNELFS